MAFKLIVLAAMLHLAASKPAAALTLAGLEDAAAAAAAADTAAVGSYVREVRAAAPEDYHKSYENEGDGEIGYSRKKQGGGKKGYQHFDSFHKKAGDNYEFEKQDSFGHDDGGAQGAYSHHHEAREQAQKQKQKRDHSAPEYEEAEPGAEREERDRTHEELKEGASDGNGGVEAHGHDPKDYVLPQKYVYGEGDEYNF